ncbi:hypothetical protein LCGC14_2801960, partial [marine sediment metagenome]
MGKNLGQWSRRWGILSECYAKLPHSCGSSDALQTFIDEDGSFSGYCFSCDTYVPDPYGDALPDAKAHQRGSEDVTGVILAEIGGYKSCTLADRKLEKETLEYFGIKIGVSEQDGVTPTVVYFPYYKDITVNYKEAVDAYKVRLLDPKKFWCIGDMKGVNLFGWDEAIATGAKKLFITEGELDTASLWQALVAKQKGTKWEQYL